MKPEQFEKKKRAEKPFFCLKFDPEKIESNDPIFNYRQINSLSCESRQKKTILLQFEYLL